MMKRIFIFLSFFLFIPYPFSVYAKAEKLPKITREQKQQGKLIWELSVKEYEQRYDAKKNFYGFDYGSLLIKDFVFKKGLSIHVYPVLHRFKKEDAEKDFVKRFLNRTEKDTISDLKSSGLFSSVESGNKKDFPETNSSTDLKLEIFTMGFIGHRCYWGFDLFDKNGKLILTAIDLLKNPALAHGFKDLVGKNPYYLASDYFSDKIPKLMASFFDKLQKADN